MIQPQVVEDILDQIGDRLRGARESAGFNVDDVIFQTRIPRSVILALEAGDFSTFSSPTYAKSFLSQYSDFLKVDARIWLDALQPASFISGEIFRPLWEASHPRKEVKATERDDSRGWFSALSILVLSGVLVFMALKGYQFLENRFGQEIVSPVAPEMDGRSPKPAKAEQESKPESVDNPPDEDFVEPPPRAIIVR